MKNKKAYLIITILIAIIILFSVFNATVSSSVKASLYMCYNSVIPALFPFFVLAEFITSIFMATNLNPYVFAFISGLISGFPTGTQNVCNLYKNNKITKEKATALLHSTANASPAYVVAFVGACLIKSKSIGYILLLSQIICSIICACSFKVFKKSKTTNITLLNVTEIATKSVVGSVSAILNVCGYIVFMGIFADIAAKIIPSFIPTNIKGIVYGSIEITRGITVLDFSNSSAILIAAFIIGFSGISVILQCVSCAKQAGLPCMPIVKGKIIYAVLMPLITFVITKIIPITFSSPSFILGSVIFVIFLLFLFVFIYIIFDKMYKSLYNK